MKTLPFFKFDAEAWLTGKIQILPIEEVGIYVNLMARIWRANGALKNDRFLPRIIGVTAEQFQTALDDFKELGIIDETDGVLRIKFIDDQLADRAEFIAKCSAGGKKRQARAAEATQSNPQGASSTLEGTLNSTSSNKKSDNRNQITEIREREIINTPAPEEMLGPELGGDFKRWLEVWKDAHGDGNAMPIYQQEAQIRMLLSLPENIRQEAVERAIRGGWKAIHDIREPRTRGGAANRQQQTGTLPQPPQYAANERGM